MTPCSLLGARGSPGLEVKGHKKKKLPRMDDVIKGDDSGPDDVRNMKDGNSGSKEASAVSSDHNRKY